MTEVMEDKVKKERMTYKDHVKYIEKVRPVLMMEQEILKSDERKKALFTFRQMKKRSAYCGSDSGKQLVGCPEF